MVIPITVEPWRRGAWHLPTSAARPDASVAVPAEEPCQMREVVRYAGAMVAIESGFGGSGVGTGSD